MLARQKQMTIEEFIVFATSPENEARNLEFINGEVVEVSPGRSTYSKVAIVLAAVVYNFCQEHNLPYNASGSEGAYRIGDNTIAPDFAYRSADLINEYPDPVPPQWAVEVISPTDKAEAIREKREMYLRADILLWEVYYPSRSVDVYAPGQPKKTYSMGDELDGGDVLPGFKLEVAKLFT